MKYIKRYRFPISVQYKNLSISTSCRNRDSLERGGRWKIDFLNRKFLYKENRRDLISHQVEAALEDGGTQSFQVYAERAGVGRKETFFRVPSSKARPGSISLMAILIMLAIAVIGLSVAFVVLGEIQASQDTANVLRAGYASETALEKGLDIVTEKRFQKATLASTVTALEKVSGSISATRSDFRIRSAEPNTVQNATFDLREQQSTFVDFFHPDNPTTGAGLASIVMTWSDTCSEASWVEIAALGWESLWDNSNEPKNYYYNCHHTAVDENDPAQCKFVSNIVTPNQSYRLRVKNISGTQTANTEDCMIKNATLTGYDSTNGQGNVITLPNSIALTSEGTFSHNTHLMSATLSWTVGASGLLDYVLFSEEKVMK